MNQSSPVPSYSPWKRKNAGENREERWMDEWMQWRQSQIQWGERRKETEEMEEGFQSGCMREREREP